MKPWLLCPVLLLLATPFVQAGVSITTTSLPNGTVDTPYAAVIHTKSGCTPFKWARASGSLPPGVSQSPSSNTTSLDLNGTPTTAGSYSFTISVTACGGHVSTESYNVTIQAAPNHVVDLSWNASASNNIAGYNLYRSPDGSSWSKINSGLIASTLYTDSTVANGSTYYYAATAVDSHGDESSRSSAVEVAIP